MIASYQLELLNSETKIAKNIAASEIELTYLNGRMADLELLKAKFPGNSGSIITQPMDPKDSSAKYLPIITQLIAVNKDISTLKENLSHFTSRKNQLAIMGSFLSQAMPVIDNNLDGVAAVTELLRVESNMRKNLQPFDWNKISALNSIKHDLTLIHTRFTLGLEQPTFLNTRKQSYIKLAAVGMSAGFFLALLFSLGSAIRLRYRQQRLHG